MIPGYEYQSEFARRCVAKGRATALLTFLEARGIPVDDTLRGRILACFDYALLDTWIARAATAQTAADVVRE
jgi:hypothetical protein